MWVSTFRAIRFTSFAFSWFKVIKRFPIEGSITHRNGGRSMSVARVVFRSEETNAFEGFHLYIHRFATRRIPTLFRINFLSDHFRFCLGRKRIIMKVTFRVVCVPREASVLFRCVHRFRFRLVHKYAKVNDGRRNRLCHCFEIFRFARLMTKVDSTRGRCDGRRMSWLLIFGYPFAGVCRDDPPAFISTTKEENSAYYPSFA